MSYQGHALDEITVDGTFKEARDAAVQAAVLGSVGTTAKVVENGVEVSSITVEAIKQQTDKLNRQFGVWSWGPAYRVKDANVVIVLADRPGRYTSHALSDLEQAIKDEVEAAEQDTPEPEAEEDYLRALLHNEDL